jgi:hypothetical protein
LLNHINTSSKTGYIKLTTDGEAAYENHRLFHQKLNDEMVRYLDGLSEEQMNALFGLMNIIERNLPDLNEEE